MGWKWADALGGAIDGAMNYGPYGAIAGGAIGGWSKDFDKGLTGNSRSGLVEKAYGMKNGNIGTKVMGNFSGDNRDSQILNEKGRFDVGKTIGSAANLASSYYGAKNGGGGMFGGSGGGGYDNPSGNNANITFGNSGGFESGQVGRGASSYMDIGKIFQQFQQQRNPSDSSAPGYDPMEHAGIIKNRYPFIPDQTFQIWLKSQAPAQGYQFAG